MTTDPNRCQHCDRPTTDVLCPRCVRLVEVRLADIPALVDDLETTIARQGRGAGSGHRQKGDDQPLPFNAAASEHRSLVNVLLEWADHVAADTGARSVPLRPAVDEQQQQTARACLTLQRHLSWFRVNPEAPDAADAIWHIRDTLRKAVDRPLARWYAGPCGQPVTRLEVEHVGTIHGGDLDVLTVHDVDGHCDLALYAKPGQTTITCDGHNDRDSRPGCGSVHTLADRRVYLLDTLEDELLPLDAILPALPALIGRNPDRATVRQWRKRRRLEARTVTTLGVELYRGGDVLALALDDQPRTGPKRRDRRPVTA